MNEALKWLKLKPKGLENIDRVCVGRAGVGGGGNFSERSGVIAYWVFDGKNE